MEPGPERPLRLFLVAGEPSGDRLGARLLAALRLAAGRPIEVAGIGGEAMAGEGVQSLFPIQELSVMGLLEVLPRVRRLARRLDETVAAIRRFRPDAVVTIDSGGFNRRLAARLVALGEPAWRIHYVAPMVWAWRPGRVRGMAECFDRLLTLFKFEPAWFTPAGLDTVFVGHPAIEAGRGDRTRFRTELGVGPEAPVLCVLPGSRRGEVRRLLPVFRQTVARLGAKCPELAVVVPTVDIVREEVRTALARWPVPALVVAREQDKPDAFAAADAALAASGTVALELALAGVPTVVGYRVNPVTALLARHLLHVRHVSLPNLLLDRPVVPEFLQYRCRPDLLARALAALLEDPKARGAQLAAFAELRRVLAPSDGVAPSRRAAEAVLALATRPRGGETPALHRPDGASP